MGRFKILHFFVLCTLFYSLHAQTPQPFKQFLKCKQMQGSSVGFMVKDVTTGEVIYSYDADRELIPASVLKLVTTATALRTMEEDFRFETSLSYSGRIEDGTLHGNLFINGSGDPTLGSSHFVDEDSRNIFKDQQSFLQEWLMAVKQAGIKRIDGKVIADDTVFDTEGMSMKWLREDMGSYYGAGSYGISVFDNIYKLYLKTGQVGTTPQITGTEPAIPYLHFHNYLTVAKVTTDSSYISGYPFSNERFLYGILPANKERYTLRGDIPDPALFLADYFTRLLSGNDIEVTEGYGTQRIIRQKRDRSSEEIIHTTFSPTLADMVGIINKKSHNLYADAVLKRSGLHYIPEKDRKLSSFGKGTGWVESYWDKQGADTGGLWMFDGSGLAPTNKVTAALICDLLVRMHTDDIFRYSLPEVGVDGSVRNFLKGTSLQGRARLKSGGMSRVRSYAGYITKGDKEYAVVILVNNYSYEGRDMINAIEHLLVSLF